MAVATGLKYPAIIDGELGGYGVVIPDIPGVCGAMGDTVDEALANATEVLKIFVELIKADGGVVPPPSDPATLDLEHGEMIAFVPLRVPAIQS